MIMKRFLYTLTLCLAVSCGGGKPAEQQAVEPEPIPAIGFREGDYMKFSTKVERGDVFSTVFTRMGLSKEDAQYLCSHCPDSVLSMRRIKIGDVIDGYYLGDSTSRVLQYAVYHRDRITKAVFSCADSLFCWKYTLPVERVQEVCDVTITESLWKDLHDAGGPVEIVPELADIFAWSVNFFGLQQGDRFQTVYTCQKCDGQVMRIESIDFSRYTSGKYVVNAIHFDKPGFFDKYYTEDGRSLRLAFLKAPLKYTRVSSKFSYARKHPVTGKVRPHTGVDYAAPSGTPVHTIGDGTVLSAGWTKTGGGNVIRIRHANGYETGYLHLRGFARGIKAGAKVKQGQTIGYVGSTGRSTGPHLDFRVWKDGKPIDPLKMKSPPAKPLPKEHMPEVERLYDYYYGMISGALLP